MRKGAFWLATSTVGAGGCLLLALCVAVAVIAPLSATYAASTNWDHNGSTIAWESDGNKRVAKYSEPRPGLSGLVERGTVLFEGVRRGQRLVGTAYVFKRGCKPAPYEVTANLTSEREFVLTGSAPIFERGAGCSIDRYDPSHPNGTLVFSFIDPNASVASDEHEPNVELQTSSAEAARIQQTLNQTGTVRYLKWTNTKARNEAELAYDVCSKVWNQEQWFEKLNPKYLMAGTSRDGSGHRASCMSITSKILEFEADEWERDRKSITSHCLSNYEKCYMFAAGNKIAEWASTQEKRVANGSRFENNNKGSGSAFASFLNSVIGGVAAGVSGYNAGTAIGNSINRGRSGGGGLITLPSQGGYSQKGAFDDCYKLALAVGDSSAAAKCKERSQGMHSIR